MPIVKIESADFLVGMELRSAQTIIADHGYDCRVVWSEGLTIISEANLNPKVDYDPLRINLHVKDGRVFKATIQ